MTLEEMKKKVLGLIEELSPESAYLTEDPDIRAKLNDVIGQVQSELARMKKIPAFAQLEVTRGEIVDFAAIGALCGAEVYQLDRVSGVEHSYRANGTVLKMLGSGTVEIDCFVYPRRISADTPDSYQFALSQDALEIMPYGVAADLLKSDVSAQYGKVYEARYETMLQRLDPRYHMTGVFVEGGVDV